jgi:predicted dienelactone hydrolase
MTLSPSRRLLLSASLASLLPVSHLQAQPTPPSDTSIDEMWTDAARTRDIPVKLRWPDAALYPGVRPLVLFSHGLGGTLEGGAVWGQAWAAAGFVVVHLQHPGSDLAAVRAVASSFTDQRGLRAVAAPAQSVARLRDVGFVLSEIERRHATGVDRWGSARTTQIGMSGHSFGALTTLGMAGQRYPGFEGIEERRLASFIALSPSLPPAGDATQVFERITRPLLSITGTRDGDMVGTGATPERRMAVFGALPPGNKAHLILKDADHMTFGGQTGRPAEIVPREPITRELQTAQHALVAAITTDWWRATLLGDASARERLLAPTGLSAGDVWQQK